jgi:hypothetical protein
MQVQVKHGLASTSAIIENGSVTIEQLLFARQFSSN